MSFITIGNLSLLKDNLASLIPETTPINVSSSKGVIEINPYCDYFIVNGTEKIIKFSGDKEKSFLIQWDTTRQINNDNNIKLFNNNIRTVHQGDVSEFVFIDEDIVKEINFIPKDTNEYCFFTMESISTVNQTDFILPVVKQATSQITVLVNDFIVTDDHYKFKNDYLLMKISDNEQDQICTVVATIVVFSSALKQGDKVSISLIDKLSNVCKLAVDEDGDVVSDKDIVTWSSILNKPSVYPPAVHTHNPNEVGALSSDIYVGLKCWQPNTNYFVGEICYSTSDVDFFCAECIKAGTSALTEPNWSVDDELKDNSVNWKVSSIISGVNNGLPIGTIMPYLSSKAPEGWLACDKGDLVKRNDYPNLWKWVQNNAPLVSETEWQNQANNQSSIGAFSTGDGTTTFRLPKIQDFIRGGSTSGVWQGDMLQGHGHSLVYPNTGSTGGDLGTTLNTTNQTGILSNKTKDMITNGTNGIPRYGNETRPKNISMIYYIKTFHSSPKESISISSKDFLGLQRWQPDTVYSVDNVCYAITENSLKYMKCLQNGTSGSVEPMWIIDNNVNDNTTQWFVFDLLNGGSGGGAGVEIGTVMPHLVNKTPKDWIVCNGDLVSRKAYPDLWDWVQKNAPLVNDAEWLTQSSKQTSVGFYSTGDGTTTFRLPKILSYVKGGTQAGTVNKDEIAIGTGGTTDDLINKFKSQQGKGTTLQLSDGSYMMWFNYSKNGNNKIYSSKSSDGISNWSVPVLAINNGTINENSVHSQDPVVILDGTILKMWFTGYNNNTSSVLYSESNDSGISWSTPIVLTDNNQNKLNNINNIKLASIIKDNNDFKMWFNSNNNPNINNTPNQLSYNKSKLIATGYDTTLVIKNDGTVLFTGLNDNGQGNISQWNDIIAIDASAYTTVGVKANGSIVATGKNANIINDANVMDTIVDISMSYSNDVAVAVKKDGTCIKIGDVGEVLNINISNWENIIKIDQGSNHVVGLKLDGTVVSTGTDINNYNILKTDFWYNIVDIACGVFHTVGLKSDGTVSIAGGETNYNNALSWLGIVAVAAGYHHTVGLKSDGTVVACGLNTAGQCNVSTWTDIVAISAGAYHTVGLKSDGTMVVAGGYNNAGNVSSWNNLATTTRKMFNNKFTVPDKYKKEHTYIATSSVNIIAIKNDGKCLASCSDATKTSFASDSWEDIISVASGSGYNIGLQRHGTVLVDNVFNYTNIVPITWTNIIAIASGFQHVVGLKSNGTVVTVGDNTKGQGNVSAWPNIVSIACGDNHTVGLKVDGTCVATGLNTNNQCDLLNWTNIVKIAAGANCTVGLKLDGTIVIAGKTVPAMLNALNWTDIIDISVHNETISGIKSDGTCVSLGTYSGTVPTWTNIKRLCSLQNSVLGIKSDGTLMSSINTYPLKTSTWSNLRYNSVLKFDQLNKIKFSYRKNIVAQNFVAAIKSNNTVTVSNDFMGGQSGYKAMVEGLRNIVALAGESGETGMLLGLKSDGTCACISAGGAYGKNLVDSWINIVDIAVTNNASIGLKNDGTIISAGQISTKLNTWTNIKSISSGQGATEVIGLKYDGTIVSTGNFTGDENVWKNLVKVVAGVSGIKVGLKNDGTVVVDSSVVTELYDAESWTDIVDIASGRYFILGLKSNGTLVSVGNHLALGENYTDIIEIAGSDYEAVAIKSDGTVVRIDVTSGSPQSDVSGFSNIKTTAMIPTSSNSGSTIPYASNVYYSESPDGKTNWSMPISIVDSNNIVKRQIPQKTIGVKYYGIAIKTNGTVVCTNPTINNLITNWTNIIAVSAGYQHVVGLKSDGTVIARDAGNDANNKCNVSAWTDIVDICAGDNYTAGLKSDGTVLISTNVVSDITSVTTWTDIIAISGNTYGIIGLKSDGTCVSTPYYDVATWTDVISIVAGYDKTVIGLKSDGTCISTNQNVSTWTDIVAVAAGFGFVVGLKSDGTVVNSSNNNLTNTLTNVVNISSGYYSVLYLKSDKTCGAVKFDVNSTTIDTSGLTDIVYNKKDIYLTVFKNASNDVFKNIDFCSVIKDFNLYKLWFKSLNNIYYSESLNGKSNWYSPILLDQFKDDILINVSKNTTNYEAFYSENNVLKHSTSLDGKNTWTTPALVTPLNSSTPGTGDDSKDYIESISMVYCVKSKENKNKITQLGLNIWQPNCDYKVGNICFSANINELKYMKCIKDGISGNTEPIWIINKELDDATTRWIVFDMLKPNNNSFGDGVDLGTIIPYLSSKAPKGWLACNNGDLVKRSDYPDLWDWVQSNAPLISETEWQDLIAIQTSVGAFSKGDGVSTFRLPKIVDFIRGGNTAGVWQNDTFKTHNHTMGSNNIPAYNWGTNYIAVDGGIYNNMNPGTGNTGDIETRPKNISMVYYIKAFKSNTSNSIGLNIWQPNTEYATGNVCFAINANELKYMKCLKDGISGNIEPSWISGNIVDDNTTEWKVIDLLNSAGSGGGGIEVGAIIPYLTNKIPRNWLACDKGDLVSRDDYPDLWKWVQINAPLITDAEWQSKSNTQSSIGAFSTGDGVSTFRLPKIVDFVRGGSVSGVYQSDAIRNITGSISFGVGISKQDSGLFTTSNNNSLGNGVGTDASRLKFDASQVVPTADENRPKNISMVYCIKATDDITKASIGLGLNSWQANADYTVGNVCYSVSSNDIKYMKCIKNGLSGTVEPQWTIGKKVNDNTTQWQVFNLLTNNSGLSVGIVMPHLAKTAPEGWLACDKGDLVSRTTYPDLWEWVQTYAPLISETEWQTKANTQTSIGYYSTGDGATTFRLPKIVDFIRGGSTVGAYQSDTFKAHTHIHKQEYSNYQVDNATHTGLSTYDTIGGVINKAVTEVGEAETRPKNITMLYCVKAFNTVLNQGVVNISSLATDIAKKQNKLLFAYIVDEKPSGTGGGAFVAGDWRTRTLNTVKCNIDNFVTLNNNQITLNVGTYIIKAATPACHVDMHKSRLQNITDNITIAYGTSENCSFTTSTDGIQTYSFVTTKITIGETKTFELQHYCGQNQTAITAMGVMSNISNVPEIYSTMEIWKLE